MGTTHLERIRVVALSARDDGLACDEELAAADPGIDLVSVGSTDAVLDRVEDGDVHCVVCEHDPPESDAVDFVRSLRARDGDVPVIAVPAEDDTDLADVLEAGATDVVERPSASVATAVLANRIRTVVGNAAGGGASTDGELRHGGGDDPDSEGEFLSPDVLGAVSDACKQIASVERRDAVADTVVSTLVDVLGADGVGVFLFDDADKHLRPVAITEALDDYYGGTTVFGPQKPDSMTWRSFVTGETFAFDDVRTAPINVYEETVSRAAVFVPLCDHGTLVAASDEVGAFADWHRHVLELVGTTATATLDRIESRASVRDRERRIGEVEDRAAYLERVTALARDLDAVVVGQSTRQELEESLVDRLVEYEWVDFAWIGSVEQDGETLRPRSWAGFGSQYLDDVDLTLADCDEPACATAREGEPAMVASVADDLEAGRWEREALARGFHSVLSVPLTTGDVRYGVLTVYADRPDAFREPMHGVLEDLGHRAAWAINAAERAYCVLSNETTEVEISIEDPDDVLSVLARAAGTTIDCLDLKPLGNGSTEVTFAAADVSAETVLASLADLVVVDSVRHRSGDETHQFSVVVDRASVGDVLVSAGAVPVEITADGTTLRVTVTIPDTVEPRTFLDRLERRYGSTKLLARRHRDTAALSRLGFLDDLEGSLTDRQLEVLRTAHDKGFFASPRRATGEDVADALDVSQPTVSHHLRQAQGKLYAILFGSN